MKFSSLFTGLLVLSMFVVVGACNDFLDVNSNPGTLNEVPEDLQLSSLLGHFSYEVVGNEPARTSSLWIQQTAYNGVPPSEDNYNHTSSDTENLWGASYIDVIRNANELNTLASANDNPHYAGIAKLMMAWNYSILTDLFGDIPYSEAMNPLNATPIFDSQESVYDEILTLIDDAITDFQAGSTLTPSSDDLLYGGDMEKWERLAYTLKARFLMHLTDAPGHTASEQATAALDALANGFEDNTDDADFAYYDISGAENPWYQFAIDSKWDTRNQLSDHYVNLLNTLADPRLPIQARPVGAVDSDGPVPTFDDTVLVYQGHPNGEEGLGTDTISSIGEFYSAADAPLTWMSYTEAKFIEAEATFINDGAAAAQPIYEEAIQASMDKLNVDPTDATNYIASLSTLAGSGDPLNEIITQKYIANFLSYEAYNDWRRTGYPALTPITNGPYTPEGSIPVRFPYPASEYSNNEDNVTATGVPDNYDALEMPVWWDTD